MAIALRKPACMIAELREEVTPLGEVYPPASFHSIFASTVGLGGAPSGHLHHSFALRRAVWSREKNMTFLESGTPQCESWLSGFGHTFYLMSLSICISFQGCHSKLPQTG